MLPLKDTVPARSFAVVNWLLIAANVVLFFVELSLGPEAEPLTAALAVVPARILANPTPAQLATLVTSMFLHGGWLHLLSNMLALYIFGDNIEDRLGHGGYLIFYLLCGLAAGLTHILSNPMSPVPYPTRQHRVHCRAMFNDRRSSRSSARAVSESRMRPPIRS
jgi:membrane associated rhomboid family serine protease